MQISVQQKIVVIFVTGFVFLFFIPEIRLSIGEKKFDEVLQTSTEYISPRQNRTWEPIDVFERRKIILRRGCQD